MLEPEKLIINASLIIHFCVCMCIILYKEKLENEWVGVVTGGERRGSKVQTNMYS